MSVSFEFHRRFYIHSTPDCYRFIDTLSPATARKISLSYLALDTADARRRAFRMLLPPSVHHAPLPVRERPLGVDDHHFWQFPAVTEKLAWQRHAALPLPAWSSSAETPLHCYLGLPWATYIDKLRYRVDCGREVSGSVQAIALPEPMRMVFRTRLQGYRRLAEAWGLHWGEDICVHTVCQHIYWEDFLQVWAELGLTDLHLAHCEPGSGIKAERYGIRVHSWPLAAANVVNPERRVGLQPDRPVAERQLFVSFIGAHMPHYRSDVRLRLREIVNDYDAADIVFDLRDDWHFNPLVYGEQIAGNELSAREVLRESIVTRRYNEVLSNSVFSLCPEGAGPNTIRLWESLAAGAIPVVVVEDWVWPRIPGHEVQWEDAAIVVRRDEIGDIFPRLRALRDESPRKLQAMQQAGRKLYRLFSSLLCFD